jgi:hypothetical protein
MDWIFTEIQKLNVANVLAIGAMIYFTYSRLCNKIEKSHDSLSVRIDNLQETVTDIDRRVCRIEGALQSKDCCILKSESTIKKAE